MSDYVANVIRMHKTDGTTLQGALDTQQWGLEEALNRLGAKRSDKTVVWFWPRISDNIALVGHYLSNDGSNTGILIDNTGKVTLSNVVMTGLANGVNAADAVNKWQLDTQALGMIWLPPVINILNTPPEAPNSGDRYIVGTSPTDAWVGHGNAIAVWGGASWSYTAPTTGNSAWVTALSAGYNWNATAWVQIIAMGAHGVTVGTHPVSASATTWTNSMLSEASGNLIAKLADTGGADAVIVKDACGNVVSFIDSSGVLTHVGKQVQGINKERQVFVCTIPTINGISTAYLDFQFPMSVLLTFIRVTISGVIGIDATKARGIEIRGVMAGHNLEMDTTSVSTEYYGTPNVTAAISMQGTYAGRLRITIANNECDAFQYATAVVEFSSSFNATISKV